MVKKNQENAWMRSFSTIRTSTIISDEIVVEATQSAPLPLVTLGEFQQLNVPAEAVPFEEFPVGEPSPDSSVDPLISFDTAELLLVPGLREEIVEKTADDNIPSPYVYENEPSNNEDVGDFQGEQFIENNALDFFNLPIRLGPRTDVLVSTAMLLESDKFFFGPYLPYFDHAVIIANHDGEVTNAEELDDAIGLATVNSWFGPVMGGLLDYIPIKFTVPVYSYPVQLFKLFKIIQQWCRINIDESIQCGGVPVPYNGTDGYCCFCNKIFPLQFLVLDHILPCLLSYPHRADFSVNFIDNYYGGVVPVDGGLALRDVRKNNNVSFINPFFTWLYSPFIIGAELSVEKLVFNFQASKPVDYKPDLFIENGVIHFPCFCCDNTGRQVLPMIEYLRVPGGIRSNCFKCNREYGLRLAMHDFMELILHPFNQPGDTGDGRTIFQKTLGLCNPKQYYHFFLNDHKRRPNNRLSKQGIKTEYDTFKCSTKIYAMKLAKFHHRVDESGKWYNVELTISDNSGQCIGSIDFECVQNITKFYK